jgi:hypothetical protein
MVYWRDKPGRNQIRLLSTSPANSCRIARFGDNRQGAMSRIEIMDEGENHQFVRPSPGQQRLDALIAPLSATG